MDSAAAAAVGVAAAVDAAAVVDSAGLAAADSPDAAVRLASAFA